MKISHSQMSSFIWNICDDVLRNVFKPNQYGRIILPFVVLRRLDCVLEPQKKEVLVLHRKYKNKLSEDDLLRRIRKQFKIFYYNTSQYDLVKLTGDQTNVLINFQNYLNGYSKNVSDIITNFRIDEPIRKLQEKDRLYELLDKFTTIDLHPKYLDNHQMGSVYEELIRRSSEMSNEQSGDHYTPRDIVNLLVSFVFGGDKNALKGKGKIRSIFDPCCGTGGMLTYGKKWVQKNINLDLEIRLYGQELNDVTYSTCKSDLLILNENPEHIKGPFSSLTEDKFRDGKYDYMITNPPFGVSWKSEATFIKDEAKERDSRFSAGIPTIQDGSLLFLQHLISKMNPKRSRIGIVFNGSPLFSGDCGSGESEIRKWIIENDWLETVVRLPDKMFFNTGITTYFWILTNKKDPKRRRKIQLIDGSSFYEKRKKALGDKKKEISSKQREDLYQIYQSFKEGEFSKIFPNNFFGYTKVIVEQPLIENGETQTDERGNPKPDPKKREQERIPLSESIDEYFLKEVKPYLPDSRLDRSKDQVGYEINFTTAFYKFTHPRSLEEIHQELISHNKEITRLSKDIEKII